MEEIFPVLYPGISDFQFPPAAVRDAVSPSTIHPTIERSTYSYLILNKRQIRKCNTVHPINIRNTYNVIINADPTNSLKAITG